MRPVPSGSQISLLNASIFPNYGGAEQVRIEVVVHPSWRPHLGSKPLTPNGWRQKRKAAIAASPLGTSVPSRVKLGVSNGAYVTGWF